MSAIPTRGLGSPLGSLLSPTPTELPVATAVESAVDSDTPRKPRRRRPTGQKTLKVSVPAAIAERVALAALVKGVRPSVYLLDLLDRHLPKLAIRQQ